MHFLFLPLLCFSQVKMLPTPAKFHYNFNLRDLSRIWEGMLHIESDTMTSLEVLLGLWKHECTRVIADRFTNAEDKEWFDNRIPIVFTDEIGEEIAARIPKEPYFVDFLRDPPEATGDEPDDAEIEAPKIYEPVRSLRILSFLLYPPFLPPSLLHSLTLFLSL